MADRFIPLSAPAQAAIKSGRSAAAFTGEAAADVVGFSYHILVLFDSETPRVVSVASLDELKSRLFNLLKEAEKREAYLWPFYGTMLRLTNDEPRCLVAPDFSQGIVIDAAATNTVLSPERLATLDAVDLSDGFVGAPWFAVEPVDPSLASREVEEEEPEGDDEDDPDVIDAAYDDEDD